MVARTQLGVGVVRAAVLIGALGDPVALCSRRSEPWVGVSVKAIASALVNVPDVAPVTFLVSSTAVP